MASAKWRQFFYQSQIKKIKCIKKWKDKTTESKRDQQLQNTTHPPYTSRMGQIGCLLWRGFNRRSMQCVLDTLRSCFSWKNSIKILHSSTVWARYGMSFQGAKSNRSFPIVTVGLCTLSCYMWSRYIESINYIHAIFSAQPEIPYTSCAMPMA